MVHAHALLTAIGFVLHYKKGEKRKSAGSIGEKRGENGPPFTCRECTKIHIHRGLAVISDRDVVGIKRERERGRERERERERASFYSCLYLAFKSPRTWIHLSINERKKVDGIITGERRGEKRGRLSRSSLSLSLFLVLKETVPLFCAVRFV